MDKKPGEILDGLVEQFRQAELDIVTRESGLKAAKKRARDIIEGSIPSIMTELNLKKIVTPKGTTITVKDDPKSDVPKKNMDKFIEWLDENGHGGIVKRNLVVAFGKDTQADTEKLLERLKDEGRAAKMDGTINYQTLQKWVRGRLEEGDEIPTDLVNVFDRRVATVG